MNVLLAAAAPSGWSVGWLVGWLVVVHLHMDLATCCCMHAFGGCTLQLLPYRRAPALLGNSLTMLNVVNCHTVSKGVTLRSDAFVCVEGTVHPHSASGNALAAAHNVSTLAWRFVPSRHAWHFNDECVDASGCVFENGACSDCNKKD